MILQLGYIPTTPLLLYLPCKTCARNGYIICSSCSGQKDIKCDTCLGEGSLTGFSNIVVKNKIHTDVLEHGDDGLTHELRWHLIELEDKEKPDFKQGKSEYTIDNWSNSVPHCDDDIFLKKLNICNTRHSKKIDGLVSENCRIHKHGYSKFDLTEFISYYFEVSGEEYRVTFVKNSNHYHLHSSPWENHVDILETNIIALINDKKLEFALEQVNAEIAKGADGKKMKDLKMRIIEKLSARDLKTKLLPYLAIAFFISYTIGDNETVSTLLGVGLVIVFVWMLLLRNRRIRSS